MYILITYLIAISYKNILYFMMKVWNNFLLKKKNGWIEYVYNNNVRITVEIFLDVYYRVMFHDFLFFVVASLLIV